MNWAVLYGGGRGIFSSENLHSGMEGADWEAALG